MNTEFKEQALEASSESLHSYGVQPPLSVGEHSTVVMPRDYSTRRGRQAGSGHVGANSALSWSLLTHTASKGDTGSDVLFLPSWKICQLGIQCVIKQTTGMLHTVNYSGKPTAKTPDEPMKTFWRTQNRALLGAAAAGLLAG